MESTKDKSLLGNLFSMPKNYNTKIYRITFKQRNNIPSKGCCSFRDIMPLMPPNDNYILF